MNEDGPTPAYEEPRRWEWPLALAAIVVLLGGCVTMCATNPCGNYKEYEQTVHEHGAPLVAALHRYVVDHGSPPDSLDALVPQYIAEVPSSGYPGQQRFEYVHLQDSSWRISVDCSCVWERFGSTYDDIYYVSGYDCWFPKPK